MKSQDLAFITGNSPHFSMSGATPSLTNLRETSRKYIIGKDESVSLTRLTNHGQGNVYSLSKVGKAVQKSEHVWEYKSPNTHSSYRASTKGVVEETPTHLKSTEPWTWRVKITDKHNRFKTANDIPLFAKLKPDKISKLAAVADEEMEKLNGFEKAFDRSINLYNERNPESSPIEYAAITLKGKSAGVVNVLTSINQPVPHKRNDKTLEYNGKTATEAIQGMRDDGVLMGLSFNIDADGNVTIPLTYNIHHPNRTFLTSLVTRVLGDDIGKEFGMHLHSQKGDYRLDKLHGTALASRLVANFVRTYIEDTYDEVIQAGDDHALNLVPVIDNVKKDIATLMKKTQGTPTPDVLAVEKEMEEEARKARLEGDPLSYAKDSPKIAAISEFLKYADAAMTGRPEVSREDTNSYRNSTQDNWSYVYAYDPEKENPEKRIAYLIPTHLPNWKKTHLLKVIRRELPEDMVIDTVVPQGKQKPVPKLHKLNLNMRGYYEKFRRVIDNVGWGSTSQFDPLHLVLPTTAPSQPAVLISDKKGSLNNVSTDGMGAFEERAKKFMRRVANGEKTYIDTKASDQFLAGKDEEEKRRLASLRSGKHLHLPREGSPERQAFRAFEDKLTAIQDTLSTAADVAGIGEFLQLSFPQGINIQNPRTKLNMRVIFDAMGNMYETSPNKDAGDPRNWTPIQPTVYDASSPYMEVLRGINALTQEGQGLYEVPYTGHNGEIHKVQVVGDNGGRFETAGDRKQFTEWYKNLENHINHTLESGSVTAGMFDALTALSAFPGMTFRNELATNEEELGGVASKLIGFAIAGNDRRAQALLERTFRGGSAYRKAFKDYNTFTKWMRASYNMTIGDTTRLPSKNGLAMLSPEEMKKELTAELIKAIKGTQEFEGHINEVLFKTMPKRLQNIQTDQEILDEIYRETLTGKTTSFLKKTLYDPMAKFLSDTIGQLEGIVRHVFHLAWHLPQVIRDSKKDFLDAAWLAAKLFVQHFTHSFLTKHFRNTKKMRLYTAGGRETRVNLGKVRRFLQDNLEKYAGINTFSPMKKAEIDRLLKNKEYAKHMEITAGQNFSMKYKPEFPTDSIIKDVTGGDMDAIVISAPLSKSVDKDNNRKPGLSIFVDIPIINPEAAGLTPELMQMIEDVSEGEEVTVAGYGKNVTLYPKLQNWFAPTLRKLKLNTLRPLSKTYPTPQYIQGDPRRTKMFVDTYGVPHIKMQYSLSQLFARPREAYKDIYHMSANATRNRPVYESDKIRLVSLLLGV